MARSRPAAPEARVEQHRQRRRAERRIAQPAELRQVVVGNHRRVDLDVMARLRVGRQQIGFRAERRAHVGDQFLSRIASSGGLVTWAKSCLK